jgi:hypothetical protein
VSACVLDVSVIDIDPGTVSILYMLPQVCDI